MPPSLPSAPADSLQISAAPLRPVIKTVVKLAETFGFWRSPMKGSATATEEMSALDNLYWIYKSRNPIERAEWAGRLSLDTDLSRIAPPAGFQPETSLTLGACGDILRSRGIDASKDILFEKIAPLLFDQDIAYANFESPVTTQPLVEEVIGDAGPPTECCAPEQFDILAAHRGKRFTVLNTTNNHMFDMGSEGVQTTLETLARNGIMASGTNASPDSYGRAQILTVNGIRLGLVTDCFGLNGHAVPEADRFRIHVSKLLSKHAPPDTALLRRQIDDCKAQDCDFILASIHWGHEFELFPRQVQVETARALVEYGADSILCHHPHVIQPIEVYRPRRAPDRQALIAYSLGSLTWGFMAPHIVLSTILNLTLTKGTLGGRPATLLARATATPVFRTYVEEAGTPVTRIEKLADHAGNPESPFPAPYLDRIRHYAELVLGPGGLRG